MKKVMVTLLILTVSIFSDVGLYMDFEGGYEDLRLEGNALSESKCYISRNQPFEGINSLEYKYNFAKAGNDYVIAWFENKYIAGSLENIELMVYGNNSDILIRMFFQDEQGEFFATNLTNIDFLKWKKLTHKFSIDEHWGGNNDGKVEGNLTFKAIVLDDIPDDKISNGSIFFDNIKFHVDKKTKSVQKPVRKKKQPVTKKRDLKEGISFTGRYVFDFEDNDLSDSYTYYNAYGHKIESQSAINNYVDLYINGYKKDQYYVTSRFRIIRGPDAWEVGKTEDLLNQNYGMTGVELDHFRIQGSFNDWNNDLRIGYITPDFGSYMLKTKQIGLQYILSNETLKFEFIGMRPSINLSRDYDYIMLTESNYAQYLYGLKTTFKYENLNTSIAFVNAINDNGKFSKVNSLFTGNDYKPDKSLYLAFSTVNEQWGPSLREISVFINDSILPLYTITNGTFNTDTEKEYLYSEGSSSAYQNSLRYMNESGNPFIYKFALPDTDVTSIKIAVDISRNYIVKFSFDNMNYKTILERQPPYTTGVDDDATSDGSTTRELRIVDIRSSEIYTDLQNSGDGLHKLMDTDNSKYNIDFAYNPYLLTGKGLLGFNINYTFKGAGIDANIVKPVENRLDLNDSTTTVFQEAQYDITLSYNTKKIAVENVFYNVPESFGTKFRNIEFVYDNDDNDEWPDQWTNETVSFIDANHNNIPDNEEYPDYTEPGLIIDYRNFENYEDFNNNDIRDDQENDIKPDYKYDYNRTGNIFNTSYKPNNNIIQFGYIYQKEYSSGNDENDIFLLHQYKRKYNTTLLKGELTSRNIIKRLKDNIADDLVNYTDPLLYKNDIVFNPRLISNILIKDVLLIQGMVDYKYNKDFDLNKTYYKNNIVLYSEYRYKINNFSLIPALYVGSIKGIELENQLNRILKNVYIKLHYNFTDNDRLFMESCYTKYNDYFNNKDYHGYLLSLGLTGNGIKIIDNIRYLFQMNYKFYKGKDDTDYHGVSSVKGQIRYNF